MMQQYDARWYLREQAYLGSYAVFWCRMHIGLEDF